MSSKLFVVIGCLEDEDHIKKLVKNVVTGVEKWIAPLPLEDQEELVQTLNNIPSLKSIPNRNADYGTVVSRYRGRILDTTVLINPTSENLNDELIDLFLTAPPRCLIGYGGFVTEDDADWILQDGIFSFNNFRRIFEDSKVIAALSEHNTKVTISCCKLGLWKNTEGVFQPESKITLEIMDSQPTFEQNCDGDHLKGIESKKQNNMEEFLSFLEDGIGNEIGGIFNTLKPPLQEGFLKIRNPCLYIFPGGNGDSAFFAVNGYNMLVNGGSCSKPWFWKLIQHVDRVDSILATHLGSDNLPGINSLLLRKLQERQVKLPMDNTTPEYQEMRRCLISPDLGPLFINAPTKFMESVIKNGSTNDSHKTDTNTNGVSSSDDAVSKHPVQKTTDIVRDTLRLSKALNMELDPLVRKSAATEPMTLFSKHGLGRLEMYVISPAEGSKELAYMNEKWGCNGKTGTATGKIGILDSAGQGDSSITNLSSICALLVWHPSSPHEKIVRVLFPGNATQTKIFEGLESIKKLPFLKAQHVTKNILYKQKHAAKPDGTHVTQKPTRSVNAANIGKKLASTTAPKKVTTSTSAAPVKIETSTATKVTDKRPKAERAATARVKPATASATTVAKSAIAKERATLKSAKTDLEKSSKASVPKKLASRPTSTAQPKTDTKRPSAVTASKASAAKTKPHTASTAKATEKPKKPQTLSSKQKTEPHKMTPPKRSTKPPGKKGTPVGKIATDKAKKEKVVPPKALPTPPEDLTAEFGEFEVAKDEQAKPTELPSTGSEEPTTSVLSDRHSPEGEDGSTIQYAESSSVAMNDKSESAKDDSKHFREYEDTGFIVMNKPEISEESDMISTDGSSAVMQQQASMDDAIIIGQVLTREELISSDKSSPEETPELEKVVKFSEPEQDEEKPHKPVERLPTPFQSLQDSSSTNEMSPVSESESTSAVGAQVPNQTKVEFESPEEDKKQADHIPTEDNKETTGTGVTLPEQTPDPPREMGSEVHSSFCSSAEGSYELYPTGRSPPPASTQETIAETISDFKHDEPAAFTDLEEPSTYLDTQPQQTELLEDPTISTEAPDARCSMSTTSTGSQFARIEPPFSSSEAGLPSLAIQQEHADSRDPEEVVDEDEMPEVDQDVAQGMEKGDVATEHPEAEDVVMTENVEHEENLAEVAASELEVIQGELDGVDENLCAEEDKYSHCEDLKPTELENYPQQVWGVQDKDVHEDELQEEEEGELHEEEEVMGKQDIDLHTLQHQYDEEQREAGEDFDEHIVIDTDQRNVMEKKELDLHASLHHDDYEQQETGEDFDEHGFIDTEKKNVMEMKELDLRTSQHDDDDDDEQLEAGEDFNEHGVTDTDQRNVMEEKELDLHASQHHDDYEQCEAGEDFDEHGVTDTDQGNVMEKKELDLHASQHDDYEQREDGEDIDEHRVLDTDVHVQAQNELVQSTEQMEEEQDGHIQMTGSLASSAQDQGTDDESEATSMTETADASESNPPPQVEFLDDGPDLKEYEHVDMGSIPKSDLVLASMEENFPLHGEPTTDGGLLGCGEQAQQKQSAYDPDELAQESDQHMDLWQDQGEVQKSAPRYHPAYLDTCAPLADTKEVHSGIDQLKDGDLDSPLDVNARPFVPKSSAPVDQSPTYGDEAQFFKEDSLSGHDAFEEPVEPAPTPPPGSNNPFLVDLMADNQQNPFNLEEPCLPPTKGPDPCAAQGKTTKSAVKKPGPGAAAARKSAVSPIYVDLVYVPNHGNKNSVGTEFFKKIRAKYYVLSGNDPSHDEPSAEVLNHLLEGRRTWFSEQSTSTSDHEDTNVTVIPTHDSHAVKSWYKQNFKELESCNIHMVASGSKVMVQVDSIEACKIEF